MVHKLFHIDRTAYKNYSIKHRMLFLAIIIFISCKCSDSSLVSSFQFGAYINGKNFICEVNRIFTMKLDVHADGGYQWFSFISDTTIVRLENTSYKPISDKKIVVGLTEETFYFKTLRKGSCNILLNEKRSWEKDVAPINHIQFTVVSR